MNRLTFILLTILLSSATGSLLAKSGGGGDDMPPPPPPDPPPAIGMEPNFHLPVARDDEVDLLKSDAAEYNPETMAFSMIGDSRTQLAHASGLFVSSKDVGHWDQYNLLGQYRTGCSGLGPGGNPRTRIHNAAISGSWAANWDPAYLTYVGTTHGGLANRVVAMMGGNDVLYRWGEYADYSIIPWGGKSIRAQVTSDIHGHTKNVVRALVASGREVIYQRHFMINPTVDWWKQTQVNNGLGDLNGYAYDDFGPEVIRWIPPMPYISGWKSHCWTGTLGWCPICFRPVRLCIGVPKWSWTKPKIIAHPKLPGVSFAQVRNTMPASWFDDEKHLNYMGYQAHALDLDFELAERCWW